MSVDVRRRRFLRNRNLLRCTTFCKFARPGFGFSERPRWRIWSAEAQAEVLHKALITLDARRVVLVGHSWATLVAIALALRDQANTAGLVLLSGYYFPTPRVDVAPMS